MHSILALISATALLGVAACTEQRNSPQSPRSLDLSGRWQRSEVGGALPPVTLMLRQSGDSLLGDAALSGLQLTARGVVRNAVVHLELSRVGTVSLVLDAQLEGADAMEGTLRGGKRTLAVEFLRIR